MQLIDDENGHGKVISFAGARKIKERKGQQEVSYFLDQTVTEATGFLPENISLPGTADMFYELFDSAADWLREYIDGCIESEDGLGIYETESERNTALLGKLENVANMAVSSLLDPNLAERERDRYMDTSILSEEQWTFLESLGLELPTVENELKRREALMKESHDDYLRAISTEIHQDESPEVTLTDEMIAMIESELKSYLEKRTDNDFGGYFNEMKNSYLETLALTISEGILRNPESENVLKKSILVFCRYLGVPVEDAYNINDCVDFELGRFKLTDNDREQAIYVSDILGVLHGQELTELMDGLGEFWENLSAKWGYDIFDRRRNHILKTIYYDNQDQLRSDLEDIFDQAAREYDPPLSELIRARDGLAPRSSTVFLERQLRTRSVKIFHEALCRKIAEKKLI